MMNLIFNPLKQRKGNEMKFTSKEEYEKLKDIVNNLVKRVEELESCPPNHLHTAINDVDVVISIPKINFPESDIKQKSKEKDDE